MKREINDQGLKIVKLEDEVQNLTDQLKHATDSVKDLTKEKQEKSKIIGDQVKLMQALQVLLGKQRVIHTLQHVLWHNSLLQYNMNLYVYKFRI